MDAKHAKTLSGFVVALFIVAAFAPLAGATNHRGTGAPDVVANAGETFTVSSPASLSGIDYARFEEGGPIQYNQSKDLIVTNLSGSENDVFYLQAGTSGPFVQSGSAQQDGAHAGMVNATWSASSITATSSIAGRFNQVGTWTVYQADQTTVAARILVNATTNLNVQLEPSAFTYQSGDVTFQVRVTNVGDGSPAAGVAVDLTEFDPSLGTVNTNVDGIYDYFGKVPQAGSFNITATRDVTGDSLPEFTGKATLTVTAAQLSTTAVSTDVLRGFAGVVQFNYTFPATSTAALTDSRVKDSALRVQFPNGTQVWYNHTGPVSGVTTLTPHAAAVVPSGFEVKVLGHGNVVVGSNTSAGWASGQHSLLVQVNTQPSGSPALSAGGVAEYTSTVSWAPGTPAAVNIQVDPSVLNVHDRAGTNGLPTPTTVTATITGSQQNLHPQYSRGFSLHNNVSLSGDFLVLTDADGNQLAPVVSGYSNTTGEFTIANLYPTKGGGQITITVNENGTAWTKALTIRDGALVEADQQTVVVDQTSTISFTLRLPSGAVDPSGAVRIFRVTDGTTAVAPGSAFGERAVAGTGNAGEGLDGQYEFTIKPTQLGTYVVYGQAGQDLGVDPDSGATRDYRNWTYTTFRVVPAHDLDVELRKGGSLFGSAATEQAINVTLPGGAALNATPEIYVLSETQERNLRANGTLPSQVTGVTVYTEGGNTRTYNYTLTIGPAGSYSVYVRSADGKHDSLNSMATFNVTAAQATFSPDAVVNNPNIARDTPIAVNLTVPEGANPNGTLIFNASASAGTGNFTGGDISGGNATHPVITVTNGRATFNATGNVTGTIRFDYRPGNAGPGTLVEGALEVRTPNVEVNPERIPVGRTSTVAITVRDLAGAPLSGLNVRICGAPIGGGCTGEARTGDNGRVTLGVNPFSTGNLTMQVNRQDTPTNVSVFAGLEITAEPRSPDVGQETVIHVAQVGQSGEREVNVTITPEGANDTVLEDTTNNLGIVRWTPDEAGTYTVRATKEGFESATTTITVSDADEQPPAAEADFELGDLNIQPTTVELGRDVLATVEVTNSGDAEGTTTVRLKVDGVTLETQSITLGAGESDTIGLTFSPNQPGDYEVSVALPDGTQAGPVTLTVERPEDTTPPPTPGDGGDGDGTGGDGDGGPGGDDGVPGFEAVFVLAALGAALIFVGRRRN